MQFGNTFQYRMNDLAIFFNHTKINIFEKTGEIIPGWFFDRFFNSKNVARKVRNAGFNDVV